MTTIDEFLAHDAFAVVGASNNRSKFGNQVLRCYRRYGKTAHAVNPRAQLIEGEPSFASLAELPAPVAAASLITPPGVAEQVVLQAHAQGITFLWFQPGAESAAALQRARQLGMTVIAGGPCVLVELPPRAGKTAG